MKSLLVGIVVKTSLRLLKRSLLLVRQFIAVKRYLLCFSMRVTRISCYGSRSSVV